ncbi:MAG TPA: hypothetical protein VHO25_01040 [Polyangiaceae bacterium]|nr:hypothetical protein [Polyangiaceae bacterium]
MAKVTKNTKVLRTLRFLLGLRRPEAHVPLAPYGLTQQELEAAAQLVRAATEPQLRKTNYGAVNPALLDELDVIDNQWFPIIKHVLTRHSPEIADWTFLNLAQSTGIDLVVSLGTLFSRLGALADGSSPFGEQGVVAFHTLQARGLTDEVLERINQLLGSVAEFSSGPSFDEAAHEEAIDKLWAWYLEWSGIARTVIKTRTVLRALGFRRRSGASLAEEIVEELQVPGDDVGTADTLPGGIVVSGALPAASNGALPPANGASNGALNTASNGASALSQAAVQ